MGGEWRKRWGAVVEPEQAWDPDALDPNLKSALTLWGTWPQSTEVYWFPLHSSLTVVL